MKPACKTLTVHGFYKVGLPNPEDGGTIILRNIGNYKPTRRNIPEVMRNEVNENYSPGGNVD